MQEAIRKYVPQGAFAFKEEGQTTIPPSPGLYTDEEADIVVKAGLILQQTHSVQIYEGIPFSPDDLGSALRLAVNDPNRRFLFGSYEAIEWILRQNWKFRWLLP